MLYMPQLGYVIHHATNTRDFQSIATICKEVLRITEADDLRPEAQKTLSTRIREQIKQLYKAKMLERKEIIIGNIIQYHYRRCLKNY